MGDTPEVEVEVNVEPTEDSTDDTTVVVVEGDEQSEATTVDVEQANQIGQLQAENEQLRQQVAQAQAAAEAAAATASVAIDIATEEPEPVVIPDPVVETIEPDEPPKSSEHWFNRPISEIFRRN